MRQKGISKAKSQANANAAKGGKWYVAPIVAQHFTAEEVEENAARIYGI